MKHFSRAQVFFMVGAPLAVECRRGRIRPGDDQDGTDSRLGRDEQEVKHCSKFKGDADILMCRVQNKLPKKFAQRHKNPKDFLRYLRKTCDAFSIAKTSEELPKIPAEQYDEYYLGDIKTCVLAAQNDPKTSKLFESYVKDSCDFARDDVKIVYDCRSYPNVVDQLRCNTNELSEFYKNGERHQFLTTLQNFCIANHKASDQDEDIFFKDPDRSRQFFLDEIEMYFRKALRFSGAAEGPIGPSSPMQPLYQACEVLGNNDWKTCSEEPDDAYRVEACSDALDWQRTKLDKEIQRKTNPEHVECWNPFSRHGEFEGVYGLNYLRVLVKFYQAFKDALGRGTLDTPPHSQAGLGTATPRQRFWSEIQTAVSRAEDILPPSFGTIAEEDMEMGILPRADGPKSSRQSKEFASAHRNLEKYMKDIKKYVGLL